MAGACPRVHIQASQGPGLSMDLTLFPRTYWTLDISRLTRALWMVMLMCSNTTSDRRIPLKIPFFPLGKVMQKAQKVSPMCILWSSSNCVWRAASHPKKEERRRLYICKKCPILSTSPWNTSKWSPNIKFFALNSPQWTGRMEPAKGYLLCHLVMYGLGQLGAEDATKD